MNGGEMEKESWLNLENERGRERKGIIESDGKKYRRVTEGEDKFMNWSIWNIMEAVEIRRKDKEERMCYLEARSWKTKRKETKWNLKEGLLEDLKDWDRVGQ